MGGVAAICGKLAVAIDIMSFLFGIISSLEDIMRRQIVIISFNVDIMATKYGLISSRRDIMRYEFGLISINIGGVNYLNFTLSLRCYTTKTV